MAAKKKTGATNSATKKTAKKKTATKKKAVAPEKKTAIEKKTGTKKKAVAAKKTSAPEKKRTTTATKKKRATTATKKTAPKKKRVIAKRAAPTPAPAPAIYEPAPIAASEMLAPVEVSRSPRRGGDHDRANHSKPEVQLQQQHLRTLRSPLRRPSVRGH